MDLFYRIVLMTYMIIMNNVIYKYTIVNGVTYNVKIADFSHPVYAIFKLGIVFELLIVLFFQVFFNN